MISLYFFGSVKVLMLMEQNVTEDARRSAKQELNA